MFNKKALLAAVLLLGTAGGLVACGDNEFEQNTGEYVAPEETMYIVGSHWNNWWGDNDKDGKLDQPVQEEFKFTRSAKNSNIYEIDLVVTAEMAAGWVGFKFTAQPGWAVQYGMEDVDYDGCNKAFLDIIAKPNKNDLTGPSSNRSNVEFKSGANVAGTYHIEYSPFNFASTAVDNGAGTYGEKFTIQFTPAAK